MLDISEIEPGLWQGAYPDKTLPREITAIVSLTNTKNPEFYHDNLHRFLWMPTHDGEFPGLDWLDAIVTFMVNAQAQGDTILVHCLAGISRSSLIVAAFLMKKHTITSEEALRKIREKRPIANPVPRYLKDLEAYGKFLTRTESDA